HIGERGREISGQLAPKHDRNVAHKVRSKKSSGTLSPAPLPLRGRGATEHLSTVNLRRPMGGVSTLARARGEGTGERANEGFHPLVMVRNTSSRRPGSTRIALTAMPACA